MRNLIITGLIALGFLVADYITFISGNHVMGFVVRMIPLFAVSVFVSDAFKK